MTAIFGIAHLTGGGFTGNIPRILPEKVDVNIDTKAWKPLPIFDLIGEKGGIDFEEMYEVFNMGMGMAVIADAAQADAIIDFCKKQGTEAKVIGAAVKGSGKVNLLK